MGKELVQETRFRDWGRKPGFLGGGSGGNEEMSATRFWGWGVKMGGMSLLVVWRWMR